MSKTYPVTATTMTKLIATIVALLTSFSLLGCDSGTTVIAQEVNSPTGCLKSQGRYYDPKLKSCVKVTDQHQALVLNTYRYVNKLAEENKLPEVQYYIYLKTYVTLQEAEELWSPLRKEGATIDLLLGTLPDNYEYDPQPGHDSPGLKKYIGAPKIWGGDGLAEGCGWMKRDDPTPSDYTIKSMIEADYHGIDSNTGRPHPELRKAIFEDGDCRISSMMVNAKPSVIRDWWNQHLDDVEAIQPRVTDLDNLQVRLGPTQPLKEGK